MKKKFITWLVVLIVLLVILVITGAITFDIEIKE